MAKFARVTQTVDGQTGELLTTERSFTTRTVSEQFVQFFYEHPDYENVYRVQRLRDLRVLLHLCRMSEYDTGRVSFGKAERDAVGVLLAMTGANLSGSMTRLRRLGLVLGRGSQIQLNPRLFWKGTSAARLLVIAQIFGEAAQK